MPKQKQLQELTFDELVWPQPQSRKELKKSQQPEGISNFEYSNIGTAIIWTANLITLFALSITAAYITSLFVM